MYCLYQLRDPANPGAAWQLVTAFSEAEYNAVKANTPSSLQIHRIVLTNVSVTVENGTAAPSGGGGNGGV